MASVPPTQQRFTDTTDNAAGSGISEKHEGSVRMVGKTFPYLSTAQPWLSVINKNYYFLSLYKLQDMIHRYIKNLLL